MTKKKVALFGASGTMGFHAFKELWKRREQYDISILVLPSEQGLGLFKAYEREAGLRSVQGSGISERNGFKIVWGDAVNYADVAETIRGADWVLNAMAYISPMADYRPELARAANVNAVENIIKAIRSEQNGAERIHYVHTGTVAETGNRPVGIHIGRVGDPLNPSVFDYYAITKIAGERLVLESGLKYWVSLRMTYIMPTTYKELQALNDAIAFHMPLDTRMENITDRDAGFGLTNCLDVPDDSDFWQRVYNMGGGPGMRMIAYDHMVKSYKDSSLDMHNCLERNWYALRNFHMQYYEDSYILNGYLRYWRDTLESYRRAIDEDTPFTMKMVSFLARKFPSFRKQVEAGAYASNKKMAETHRNSPRYWYTQRNDMRITAFFKSYEDYEQLGKWDVNMPNLDPNAPAKRLDHGYDEHRDGVGSSDLQSAARFRGGKLVSRKWDGDVYSPLKWECAFGHTFEARPFTVLKAGHWCPTCEATWNGDEQAKENPFFAQVWYADHDPDEQNAYPDDCINDIKDADREYATNK